MPNLKNKLETFGFRIDYLSIDLVCYRLMAYELRELRSVKFYVSATLEVFFEQIQA